VNKMLIVALMILCSASTYASEVNHAVLVAAAGTPVEKISNKELKRLYLGYPMTSDKRHFEPLVNQSNKIIYQGFLQKVMFMSEQSYNRKLVTRVFRHGGERPPRFQQRDPLISALKKNTNAITFMTPELAAGIEGIQVVQPLW